VGLQRDHRSLSTRRLLAPLVAQEPRSESKRAYDHAMVDNSPAHDEVNREREAAQQEKERLEREERKRLDAEATGR
jgi:hypothetical protein